MTATADLEADDDAHWSMLCRRNERLFFLRTDISSQQTATLLGTLGGFFEKSVVYDAEGREWQTKGIDSLYKRTWWTLLLGEYGV